MFPIMNKTYSRKGVRKLNGRALASWKLQSFTSNQTISETQVVPERIKLNVIN